MSGYVTNGLVSYIPSGGEQLAVDTGLGAGAPPQVAELLVSQLGSANNFRNLLEGADFSVNPWQRGTSFTGISNTLTYGPDRWFALGGASSSISMSRQSTPLGNLASFRYALRFGRAAANADTAAISLGNVLGTFASVKAQGKTCVMSLLAVAGANFSAAGGTITVSVIGGTGSDESAANMMAGSWTGSTTLMTTTFAITNTAWGSATQLVTPSFAVPATINELGVKISFTPVGTAGSNDWIEIAMMQLEASAVPSQWERRRASTELQLCQRYFYQINEPANAVVVAIGACAGAANTQQFCIPLPVTMRTAPTTAITAGSWKVQAGAAAAAATGLAGGAAATNTLWTANFTTTLTQAAGGGAALVGGGGAGTLTASSDY